MSLHSMIISINFPNIERNQIESAQKVLRNLKDNNSTNKTILGMSIDNAGQVWILDESLFESDTQDLYDLENILLKLAPMMVNGQILIHNKDDKFNEYYGYEIVNHKLYLLEGTITYKIKNIVENTLLP